MYKIMRSIHLCLGTFSLLYMLMYGISAVQMAHFNIHPAVSDQNLQVSAKDARSVARELMDRGLVAGEVRDVVSTPGGFKFKVVKLAVQHDVAFNSAKGEAQVRTRDSGMMGMLNRIHHTGGLWHDSATLNTWGVFIGLVSVALILMSATGIYMWFKLHTERRIGGVLLGVSSAICLTLIVLIRVA